MIRNHLDVWVPLHRLLHWGRRALDRAGSARVRDRAADVGEEAENVSHAMLHLGVLEAVASHCHELLWPQVHQIGYFTGGHQNAAGESQALVLKELMHLEAALQKHISVVAEDGRLALEVDGLQGLLLLVLDLICAKDDTLAVEVRQDVIGANKLHAPVKTVQNVSLLGDELVICERNTDVFEELLDARVCHLVILGRNEDGSSCDESQDLML